MWEGYGWPEFPRQFEPIARVQLEHRACLLGEGSLDAALTLPMDQAPTMWWPEDRAWCVRTDIDGYSTYLAASRECIEGLVALESVEVLRVDRSDEVPD